MPTRKVPQRASSRLDLATRVARPVPAKPQAEAPRPSEQAETIQPPDAPPVQGRITWLGDMLTPDRNSLGVMRLILALAVLVSHSVYLTTADATLEPLYRWTNYTLGQHGVQVFFFLSGILVAQSLYQSRDVRDYVTARALRVFPALIVCVLATALILGPWLTLLPGAQYLKDMGVAAYIVKTISLISGSAQLPELFHNNPVAHVVNTSVWTLKYEVMCYAILAAIGWVAIKTNRWREVSGVAIALWLAAVLYKPTGLELHGGTKSSIEVLRYFTIFFGAGAAAFALRRFIPVHAAVLVPLGAMFAVAIGGRFQEIAAALFLGYLALWLSTFRFGPMRAFSNGNDYSYATYLFHMPVAQALLHFWPDMHVVPLILATTGIVIWMAYLSWELIERPSLNLRHHIWKTTPHSAESTFDAALAAAKTNASAPATAAVAQPLSITPSKEVAAKAAASARAAERLVREMAAAQAAVQRTNDATAEKQIAAATAEVKTEPGRAQVWRPMPAVKKLKILADDAADAVTMDAPAAGAPTPAALAPAIRRQMMAARPAEEAPALTRSRFAAPLDLMRKVTASTPAPIQEPDMPLPRVPANRIAFATKRPAAADVAPIAVAAEPQPPAEPTRAVVAVGEPSSDDAPRSRVAQPRPNWSRPLGQGRPLPA
jgi:peptidoglycan/LPS O-acetylase OafA/YrhL